MHNIPQALTIAGSDSGGGAGIQADLKTFQMRNVFGTVAITAVTAQNTLGVFDIYPVSLATIRAQIKAVAEDFSLSAVKIGMLGDVDIIETVADCLQQHQLPQIVLDPVMIAKGGAPLLPNHAVAALKQYIVPQAKVITPNLPEAEALTGIKIIDEASAEKAARLLQEMGAETVVIKGGHSQNSQSAVCLDWIFTPTEKFTLSSPRFPTQHTHGTGCTFSACITAELAKGHSVEQAIHTAKAFITAAISHPLNLGHGHGPTNHWAYQDE
ncbi:hydroxymethylpyrimidine/phosphomethylpyrimidine kinase [Pasteurella langaaensis DSM 22999]|uniref:hydroxymethylpyrimidine kinase n=1 Tax=Alitibacter langaaensis DSM 22999 TaxID=1122935 RepID=A0A2U0T8A4_9PAST|nr:bifunctional hydroxymethylpyrimidine kinase/phosphomethylpyrimidine kinase [Pasteurella langaaensis]PVX39853.1 hydroxymethylpyrimidine/phosphomethylpyrimidine kinase [Pasteurella langaaensis DSM 22999]